MTIIDEPARTFQVWAYTVGMRRLLLRSAKGEGGATRVDVLFQSVKAFKLASGSTIEEAAQGIKDGQVGTSTVGDTVGDVREAGGSVRPDKTKYNPPHCLISGCTADVLSDLFTSTIKNPWK